MSPRSPLMSGRSATAATSEDDISPGHGTPLAAHIVVGHRLFSGGARENARTGSIGLDSLPAVGLSAAGRAQRDPRCASDRTPDGHRSSRLQGAAPARKIPADRRFRHHHVVEKTRAVRENKAAGTLGARGIRSVVEENSTPIQMALDEAEEFGRQEIGDVGAEVPRRVRDDRVECRPGFARSQRRPSSVTIATFGLVNSEATPASWRSER